jgi:hypothetical protein
MLQDGSGREMGYQSSQEASVLSRPAATQQIHIQRLSLENKGGFLIYHLEQVTEMGVQPVPYMVTCYVIVYFNLWGEVTLL